MNNFIFFPNIYNKITDKGMFIYNPFDCSYLIINNNEIKDLNNLSAGILKNTKENQLIINKLLKYKFGYLVNSTTLPININKTIFTSSKQKINSSSTYQDGYNALNLVEHINIFLENKEIKISPKLNIALNFPPYNNEVDYSSILNFFKGHTFPNVSEVELITSMSDEAISLANELKSLGYPISLKIIITKKKNIDALIKRIKNNPDIIFKVKSVPSLSNYLKNYCFNNLLVTYWSTDLNEIIKYKDINIIPILYDTILQKDLLNEILLSEDDILSIKTSSYQLKYNSLFNRTFMGKIWINSSYIWVGNQFINPINNFEYNFSNWLYNPDCLWFYSRKKKEGCTNCFFSELCPSVSHLEIFEILDRPCSIIQK